jgi:uncharacterized protein
MDWKGGRRSDNIEDRRNYSAAGAGAGLGLLLRFLPFLLQTKLGRSLLVIGVIGYFGLRFLGIDVLNLTAPVQQATIEQSVSAQDQELVDFVSVVLANTEDTWAILFQQMGREYQKPKLVLFRDAVSSACGFAQSAMGPFYCPGDNKLYIDLAFYQEMKTKLGAPGDFAQAYVIAHEVGHHVQNLLGIAAKVNQLQQGKDQAAANRLSVLQELQADCFAGIWGHYADKNFRMIEDGDLEEALNAASAIGDDNLQQRANGRIRPEAFTHGTSRQRMEWFKRGMETGDVKACNTFADTAR